MGANEVEYSRRDLLILGLAGPSCVKVWQGAGFGTPSAQHAPRAFPISTAYSWKLCWCNRDEIIYLEKPSRNAPPVVVHRRLGPNTVVDPPRINKLIKDGADRVYDATRVFVSPDGRRALLCQNTRDTERTAIAAMDGSDRVDTDCNTPPRYVAWSPTSSRVHCFTESGPFQVR